MANFAMVTTSGLDFITGSHPDGVYIDIGYYVPVYDIRIDKTVFPVDESISAGNIYSCTNSADTYPQGEILWALDENRSYRLTSANNYLYLSGSETITVGSPTTATGYAFREKSNINTFINLGYEVGGVPIIMDDYSPISTHISGSTAYSPGTLGTQWNFDDYGLTTSAGYTSGLGPSDLSQPRYEDLYRGVTYQHVISDDGIKSTSNFKVDITMPWGSAKFNKIGVYAIKRLSDGELLNGTGEPFLFAQVALSKPVEIEGGTTIVNLDRVTSYILDIQLRLQSTTATFEPVLIGTSGDYWVRCVEEYSGPYGLSYDGNVIIANTAGVTKYNDSAFMNSDISVAKLTVGTFERVTNVKNENFESDMPQLCLQYVDDDDNGVTGRGRIRTTFRTTRNGDLEIGLNGSCDGDGLPAVIPEFSRENSLGKKDVRWYGLYLSDEFHLYNAAYYSELSAGVNGNGKAYGEDRFDYCYIHFDTNNKRADFHSCDVFAGVRYLINNVSSEGNLPNRYFIHGNLSSYYDSEKGFYHDLLIRTAKNLHMITLDEFLIDIVKDEIGLGTLIKNSWESNNDPYFLNGDSYITPYLNNDGTIHLIAGQAVISHGDIIPLIGHREGILGIEDVDGFNLGSDSKAWKRLYTNNIRAPRHFGTLDTRYITVYGNIVPQDENRRIDENRSGGKIIKWKEINAEKIGREGSNVSRGFFKSMYVKSIDGEDGKNPIERIGNTNSRVKDIWCVNIHPIKCDIQGQGNNNNNNTIPTWKTTWKAIWDPYDKQQNEEQIEVLSIFAEASSNDSHVQINATGIENPVGSEQYLVNCVMSFFMERINPNNELKKDKNVFIIYNFIEKSLGKDKNKFVKFEDDIVEIELKKSGTNYNPPKIISCKLIYDKFSDNLIFAVSSLTSTTITLDPLDYATSYRNASFSFFLKK